MYSEKTFVERKIDNAAGYNVGRTSHNPSGQRTRDKAKQILKQNFEGKKQYTIK